MQSVRTVVKNIGNPNPALQVVSPQQADQEIQYNYTSQGYVLHSTHYLGAVPTADGGAIQGYKFAYIFVKNDSEDPTPVGSVGVGQVALTGSDSTNEQPEKRKPGRPATKAQ